ncbi:hypothetical protein [Wolbachia endosymbiont (group A) of Scambus nigricans]|uniref:hypothetical protein n=1 Tax=Wolbachia endosymbiont (group A) of Scambus nigricans TaxID=2954055 RepID=UPI002231103C|nr:hypothetical protein [Wolbachia endosymbiont (group A) of Scambus nigricans]
MNNASIALFTIIRTDRNMLLACYSHKHISYRIRTIIRKAIKHKKRQYFKADNNHGASFAFFLFGKFLNVCNCNLRDHKGSVLLFLSSQR